MKAGIDPTILARTGRPYGPDQVLANIWAQRKYADAESLLLEGYQGMMARKKQIAAPDLYHLDRAHEWIVELDRACGQPKKAAEWRERKPSRASSANVS